MFGYLGEVATVSAVVWHRYSPGLYEMGAHDAHPNAQAHDRIADYVLASILAHPPLRQAAAAK